MCWSEKKLTASRTLQFCSRLTKWQYRHLTQKLQRTGNLEFPCWIEQWHPKVQKCPPTELIIPTYPFHCWFYPITNFHWGSDFFWSYHCFPYFPIFSTILSHHFPIFSPQQSPFFRCPSRWAARWAPAPPRESSSWPPACRLAMSQNPDGPDGTLVMSTPD